MNDYLIELHNVPHEVALYVEELKMYGDIKRYSERFPLWIWLESPWEKDILEKAMGVKQVKPPLYRRQTDISVII
jgi:hypothetical protein